ncbi:MAG: enoyl-CoA hydratase-related protein [Bacteroidota bacterium]
MSFSRLSYFVEQRICRISLCRPEKRNALDDLLVNELTRAFIDASKDSEVKVIVLTGNGKAFCAGADLDYLQKLSSYDFNQNLEDSKNLARLFHLIYTMRKPVIAKVNGAAIAGGCGLATACDIVVASEESTFGYTEVSIGFIPAIVLTFLVRRIGEGRARELALTGKIIDAKEAHALGIVNEIVPLAGLDARVQELADSLCMNGSASSMGLIKEMFSKMDGLNFSDLLDYASNMNAAMRMSDDCKKGIASFLKKEKLKW